MNTELRGGKYRTSVRDGARMRLAGDSGDWRNRGSAVTMVRGLLAEFKVKFWRACWAIFIGLIPGVKWRM
jgi:hypothetical protein